MFSIESFHKQYETDTTKVVIRGQQFHFFVPKSPEPFIDSQDVFHDFPLWSKIWEASLILADHLAGMTVEPEKHFLEIGSGIGLAGIIAACFGHRVTITEYDSHALNFIRANAEINGCSNLPEIRKLDWYLPKLDGTFDYIIGSEVVYSEKSFKPLSGLFKTFLKPCGEIILAEGMRKTTMKFLDIMEISYEISARKKILRTDNKEIQVALCKISPKI